MLVAGCCVGGQAQDTEFTGLSASPHSHQKVSVQWKKIAGVVAFNLFVSDLDLGVNREIAKLAGDAQH